MKNYMIFKRMRGLPQLLFLKKRPAPTLHPGGVKLCFTCCVSGNFGIYIEENGKKGTKREKIKKVMNTTSEEASAIISKKPGTVK